jgi:hypothetical protein
MKRIAIYLMMGFMFSFLSGCNMDEDGYSLGNVWIGYGLIHKNTVSETFTIELDNGAVLLPVTNSGWYNEVKDNQRVLANFTIVDDKKNADETEQYYVKINSLRNILYKGILDITPAIEDSIGNDPIHVDDHWLKNNMLNFELKYRGESKIHFINLVKQPGATANANEPIILELRHNTNGDPKEILMTAVVTFDLSTLKVQGKDSISFKVISKDFDGKDFEFSGVYKY